MKKPLSEMTLEELWQLFPIILTEHQECWKDWYTQESAILQRILPPEQIVRISHIGSTAIEGIWAKPTVDILIETTPECDWDTICKIMDANGYGCMSKNPNRITFNKGYTEDGFSEKVFHLHLRRSGDHDELYFRDYLNEHPNIAKEYEQLKLGLWKKHEHNRDAYTMEKSAFVAECTKKAKADYQGRYE